MAPMRRKKRSVQNLKATSDSSSDVHTLLKQKLKITPKTATMLMKVGYTDYRDLRTASPRGIVKQFSEELGMDHKLAKAYCRPLRRMVWVGTQDNSVEHAKICSNWSQRELKAKGVWSEDFDSLTGDQIEERFKKAREDVKSEGFEDMV